METIIHCDKCNSTDVSHKVVKEPVTEQHKTMTEVAHGSNGLQAMPLVYKYTNYELMCNSCGYKVTYSR